MARYRVRVTASYPTEEIPTSELLRLQEKRTFVSEDDDRKLPAGLLGNLSQWVSGEVDKAVGEVEDARQVEVDHSIPPPRATVTTVYEVEANAKEEARRLGEERFASAQVDSGIAGPETVITDVELV